MKIFIMIPFFFVFTLTYSREKDDSLSRKLKAAATVSLNSNGIASIPAFSLDKPAIIAAISLEKGRFSYEPTLAYGLNLAPWVIDNWLQYKIIKRPVFEFRAGMIISTFFCEYKLQEDTSILQAQRYFTFIFTGVYKISQKNTVTLAYWNDRGQDRGTIIGHYFNVLGERSGISISKHILMTAALQIFYINYDGKNDGLFISPRISASVINVPLSLFFQGIQALKSNISPFPDFRWNVGLGYTL